MKDLPIFAAVVLIATLLVAALPTEAEAKIYEDTVRLHILAESDSDEDQALKLYLRDKLLEKYGATLSSLKSKEDAESTLTKMLDGIRSDAVGWIRERGYDYSVAVTLTEEWYGTREYEDFTLPSGIYTSLKVVIGEGEGKNWWCVMYPPLCIEIAKEENAPAYTDEEIGLITQDGYRVKFKLLEIISSLFSKNR